MHFIIDPKELAHWIALAAQLKTLKTQERALRGEIELAIYGPGQSVGSRTAVIADKEIKISRGLEFTVKKDDLMTLIVSSNDLSDEEKACVTWKPAITKSKYEKLPEDSLLRTIVTAKLGAPKLEVN